MYILYTPLFYKINLKVEYADLSGGYLVMVMITIIIIFTEIEHSSLFNLL